MNKGLADQQAHLVLIQTELDLGALLEGRGDRFPDCLVASDIFDLILEDFELGGELARFGGLKK